MASDSARIDREKATLKAMVQIYCRGHHNLGRGNLCPHCLELLQYGNDRLNRCPYASAKGPCAQCDIHCYKPEMRKHVREVMRYAGPRMLTRHPILALLHMIDGYKHKLHRKDKRARRD